MTMNTLATTVVLALATPALAFQQPSPASPRTSVAALNSLRDMAAFPDDMKMMSEFEAFDRNGAFSRSPQGGMGGRPDMMYGNGQQGMQGGMQGQGMQGGGMGGNPNPFSRRGGGNDRMYTRDGFDPFSAYGSSFGMSQSDNRRGAPPGGGGGMEYFGGPGGGPDMRMMGGGMNGGMNGVKADNTMGGFSYSSRNREYGYGGPGGGGGPYGEGMPFDGFEEGMGGGFDGPMGGPMGGGMEQGMGYEQQQGPPMGGGYGGFDGDMSRLGP